MKYLIEPNYVTRIPLNFIPRGLTGVTGIKKFRKLDNLTTGRFNKKSFKPYNPRGFDGMEFNFSFAYLFTEDWEIKENRLEKFKSKNWPLYTFHAGHENGLSKFRDAYTNLTDDDELTKKKIKKQVTAAAELQRADGVGKEPIIVFHLGHVSQKMKVPSVVLKNLEVAVKEAEDRKIIIAIENMPYPRKGYYVGADYKDLEHVLEEMKSPWLKVCFDWGHANSYARNYAQKTKNPEDYLQKFSYHSEIIDALNQEICYAHMHYNRSHQNFYDDQNGKLPLLKIPRDEHLPLSRIEEEHMKGFERTVKEMIAKTSILKHDFILLELMPYTFWPKGSTLKEQIKSIEVLEKIIS